MKQFLLVSGLIGTALMFGCNQTTQKDVTAARDRTAEEQRKLDDAKRDEARTVNKPIIDDAAERRREAERARERVRDQEERVLDAKRDEVETKRDLANEQARDKFLIDCKASIDLANRAVEKLQTGRNAATEDEKANIDRQITDLKAKRDALQSEINNIRTANIDRWSDHHAAAKKAMDDLNAESRKVS
jgi:pyocin large subunit-like protein